MKTIVSILSDQLIPNVLFIKQFEQDGDNHIFLTTEKMEKNYKSSILADVLAIEINDDDKLIIDPHNPQKILQKLNAYNWDKNASYIVNITGGTKMMSQVAFQHFSKFPNAEIYYWPGSNYLEQLHPILDEKPVDEAIELDLKTYFAAQGYSFESEEKLSYSFQRTETLYLRIVKNGSPAAVSDIINAQKKNYYKDDKKYLTGGWFEEWLYHTLKESLKLPASQIALNLKLKSKYSLKLTESDNEIDLAFVYKNVLYIFECKVFTGKNMGKKIIASIYKISSIRHSLGLKATAMVAILTAIGTSNDRVKTIQYLSQMTNVERVFSLEDMRDKESFFNAIKKIINYE